MPRASTPLVHGDLFTDLGLVGWFDQSVTIEENTPTQNARGEPAASWDTVSGMESLSCRVAPATGGSVSPGDEHRDDDGVWTEATHVVVLEAPQTGITTAMRAVVGTDTHDIVMVAGDAEAASTWLWTRVVT